MESGYQYLYGPLPSPRTGRSLGTSIYTDPYPALVQDGVWVPVFIRTLTQPSYRTESGYQYLYGPLPSPRTGRSLGTSIYTDPYPALVQDGFWVPVFIRTLTQPSYRTESGYQYLYGPLRSPHTGRSLGTSIYTDPYPALIQDGVWVPVFLYGPLPSPHTGRSLGTSIYTDPYPALIQDGVWVPVFIRTLTQPSYRTESGYQYLYGPLPSPRTGRSLGTSIYTDPYPTLVQDGVWVPVFIRTLTQPSYRTESGYQYLYGPLRSPRTGRSLGTSIYTDPYPALVQDGVWVPVFIRTLTQPSYRTESGYQYLYGPLPSPRTGRSLGTSIFIRTLTQPSYRTESGYQYFHTDPYPALVQEGVWVPVFIRTLTQPSYRTESGYQYLYGPLPSPRTGRSLGTSIYTDPYPALIQDGVWVLVFIRTLTQPSYRTESGYQYLYGPLPSPRTGRSLGTSIYTDPYPALVQDGVWVPVFIPSCTPPSYGAESGHLLSLALSSLHHQFSEDPHGKQGW